MHFRSNDPDQTRAAFQPLCYLALDPAYGVTGTKNLNGQIRSAYPITFNRSCFLDSFASNERNVRSSDGIGILLKKEPRFSGIHVAEILGFCVRVKRTSDIHGH